MSDEPETYGTVAPDAPVTRAELDRALRHLVLADMSLRDAVLQVGARVVALTDEVTRRIDGVEPAPAEPGTPADPPSTTIERAVMAALPELLARIRAEAMIDSRRVMLDYGGDKYAAEAASPPCDELLHLCEARCCTFDFALSSADLDEGVLRWDHGQPYMIRQRASDGYCVHNHPTTRGCTVHGVRPRVCRVYDCRHDHRVWLDYDRRIPAPRTPPADDAPAAATAAEPPVLELDGFDLLERARAYAAALAAERRSISRSDADDGPVLGPPPVPRSRPR